MEPRKKLNRRFVFYSALLALIFISTVCTLTHIGVIERADLKIYDLHFRWRGTGEISDKIVLVFLDQQSAVRLERKKGQWSRENVSKALKNLCNAGAEVIGIDMVFFAPGEDPDVDAELSRAIYDCNNVVLAKFIAVEGRGEVNPLPIFQESMIGDGFINTFPDKDDVLRRTPLLSVKPLETGLSLSPSFPLEIARTYLYLDYELDFSGTDHFYLGAKDQKRLRLPYPDLLINYLGGEESFQSLSFADAVHGSFDHRMVEGKIVLLGTSLATDKDFYLTPFPGKQRNRHSYRDQFNQVVEGERAKTAGVACHAHAIETILNQEFIKRVPDLLIHLSTLILGLIGIVFYMQRPGMLWCIVIFFSGHAALFGISHVLFTGKLVWLRIAPPLLILYLQFVTGIVMQRLYSRFKNRLITDLFGKYVSPSVVNDLLQGEMGVSLEGQSQVVTVLFSDLRSFTTLSENLSPRETGILLNTYFDAMIPVVFNHRGTLDKLIGDAIMCFFGAPARLEDHPSMAALTALAMMDELESLKREKKIHGVENLNVGIGLNSGEAIVGNLGSNEFMDYTVIGDTVNLASRLEGLNKVYGTGIIVSQATGEGLNEGFFLRELDLVMVKGKKEAVRIFELIGLLDSVDGGVRDMVKDFETALNLYRESQWDAADSMLDRILSVYPEDSPSLLYKKRIMDFRVSPPPSGWKGETLFTTK